MWATPLEMQISSVAFWMITEMLQISPGGNAGREVEPSPPRRGLEGVRLRSLSVLVLTAFLGGVIPGAAVRACADGTPCRNDEPAGCCAPKVQETSHCASCPDEGAGSRIQASADPCGSGGCRIITAGDHSARAMTAAALQILPDLALLPAQPCIFVPAAAGPAHYEERSHLLRAPPDRLFSPSRAPPA